MAELNKIIGEQERLQQIEDDYNNAIAAADAAFAAGNYSSAKDAYLSALTIKAEEQYPTDQLNEIEGLLDEQARMLAIENAYNKAIGSADSLLNLKKYDAAKAAYGDALAVKANESYPQQKINDIDAILTEIENKKPLMTAMHFPSARLRTS